MDSYVLCGMQFGDEGKGSFVDYLTFDKNASAIVKYNGGSHASHTVFTPDKKMHKFSQLGSGMFLDGTETYLTDNMVINLDNLLVEIEHFSEVTGESIEEIIKRVYIHKDCYVVTPYHKLLNKLRELSLGDRKRGSVGTGVSEVKNLLLTPKIFPYERPLGVQVQDIFNQYSNNILIGQMERLQAYVKEFYSEHKKEILENTPQNMKTDLEREIQYLLRDRAFFEVAGRITNQYMYTSIGRCLKDQIFYYYESTLRKNHKVVIYEGSQGLLIDGTYGIKPNTTYLDTTIDYAVKISSYKDDIHKIGVVKAVESRHGPGIFPTESEEVSSNVEDDNQEETFWNGKIRFGWFDLVLFRYAQNVNCVDELFLSSVDKLDSFKKINICTGYIYNDEPNRLFKELFDYSYMPDGRIAVTDIKKNDPKLIKFLEKCEPSYITIEGWLEPTRKVTKKEQIPEKCREFIRILEALTELPITVVSFGPTRLNKIRM